MDEKPVELKVPVFEDNTSEATTAKNEPEDNLPGCAGALGNFVTCSNVTRFCFFLTIVSLAIVIAAAPPTFIWALPVIGVTYIIYWIDIFCFNTTFKFLNNTKFVLDVFDHVNTVRTQGIPVISWHMECYHYETRSRCVTETNDKGETVHRTEYYQETVTTWTGSENFQYNRCVDLSVDLQGLFDCRVTRLTLHKTYRFADDITKLAYEQQYACFLECNRNRDSDYTISEKFTLSHYEKRIMSFLDGNVPWFMNSCWYLLACIPLMEIPYNFVIRKNSKLVDYVYVKQLSMT